MVMPGKEGRVPEAARGAGPARGVATELGRLFDEAITCLGSTDLSGANEALKRAHAEVSSPRNAAGPSRSADAAREASESEDRG